MGHSRLDVEDMTRQGFVRRVMSVGLVWLVVASGLTLSVVRAQPAKADPAPGTITTIAGDGTWGDTGDGGSPTSAEIDPEVLATDGSGDVFIDDNCTVREITSTTITTVVGNGTCDTSSGVVSGAAMSVSIEYPSGLAVDGAGNLYIAEPCDILEDSAGEISTIAGEADCGDTGDGGPASSAELQSVDGLAVDSAGDVYLSENEIFDCPVKLGPVQTHYSCDAPIFTEVREITASTGDISVVAGTGTPGYSGDGGSATSAELVGPMGLAVDSSGDLFIADTSTIREVSAETGDISTVAGRNAGFDGVASGDGGPATSASFGRVYGVSVDSHGAIYAADYFAHLVRVIATNGDIYTIGGTGAYGYSGDGGPANEAELTGPEAIALDSSGNLDLVDSGSERIRQIYDVASAPTSVFDAEPFGGPITASLNPGGGNASVPNCACTQRNTDQPVNTATGNFWHTFTDIAVPGRGLPLDLSQTYNSQDASINGPLGYGWSFTYGMSASTDGSGNVTISQEEGSQVTFEDNYGYYSSQDPGVVATLTKSGSDYILTRQNRDRYTFSASTGSLLSETDLHGYTTSLTYNGSGQLTTVTDPASRTLSFAYNTSGLISSVTGPASADVTFSYDTSGNLASITNVDGGVTSFTYDSSHRMLTMLDPNQQSESSPTPLTNVYNSSGEVTSQSDEMGRVTSFNYTAVPGATEITDPNGNVTVDYYTYGELTKATVGYGTSSAATTLYSYDPQRLGVEETIYPDGSASLSSYDNSGNLVGYTDESGNTTTYAYDSLNDLTSETNPEGVTTTYTYNSDGDLTESSTPLVGSSPAESQTTTYTYGDSTYPGDVTEMTNPDGYSWTYGYDTYGDEDSVTDPLGNETTAVYNALGQETSSVSARGNVSGATPANFTTTYTYSPSGQLLTETDPLSHETTYTYDADGNKASVKDGDGHTTTYTYDADDELVGITNPDSTTEAYTYDGDGNELTYTDANSHTEATYAYSDPAYPSLATSSENAEGQTTSYTYDSDGQEATTLDPAGRTTSYTYDPDGNVTATDYSDGLTPSVSYTYTDDGHRATMTDGTGTTSYTYDSLGRLTSSTDGAGNTVGYGYDLVGNQTEITYPGSVGSVTYTYNHANQLTSVTDWNSKTTTYTPDPDGNDTAEALPNGDTSSQTFNDADQLTDISDAPTSTPGSPFASFSYTRDDDGQVTGETDTGVPTPTTQSYSYDQLNRLTTTTAATYSYDSAGNLTTSSAGATQAYNSADQLTSATGNTSSTDYAYDPEGERIAAEPGAQSDTQYNYNQAGQLTGVSTPAFTTALAAGEGSTYQLHSDGSVWAWGDNSYGELGNGTTTDSTAPVQVSGLWGVTAIAAGQNHALALLGNGTVWAWGDNTYGELGNNTTTSSDTPVEVSSLSGVVAISAGDDWSMALTSSGAVYTWGWNQSGELGTGGYGNKHTPYHVTALSHITSISAGEWHGLAVSSTGSVYSWGYNGDGQLGRNGTTNEPTPGAISGLSGVQVAGGALHSLVLQSNGTVESFGDNADGQLGNNSTTNSSTAVTVSSLTGVTALAGGDEYSLALKDDGTLWAWGAGGPTGTGSWSNALVPTEVGMPVGSVGIAAGYYHAGALTKSGMVYTWGFDGQGQLGEGAGAYGDTTNYPTVANTAVAPLSAGYGSTYDVHTDGTVWSWGDNDDGQLGNGSTTDSTTPVEATGLSDITAVAGGYDHALALRSDGTVWAWGDNGDGELGNGSTTNSDTPVEVSGLGEVVAIAAGQDWSMALDAYGTVWVWGAGSSGQLGQGSGDYDDSDTPEYVPGLPDVVSIGAGAWHAIAAGSDGSVWTWGYNGQGQLGDGNTTSTQAPGEVSGISSATSVAAGPIDSLVLLANGTAEAFGDNSNGELGSGTTTDSDTPVSVRGLSDVVALAGGNDSSEALSGSGQVWTWGNGGELGDGSWDGSDTAVLAQVPGATGAIAEGYYFAAAATTGGDVYEWSSWNSYGNLGPGADGGSTNVPVEATTAGEDPLVGAGPVTQEDPNYNGDGLEVDDTVNGTTTNMAWDTSGSVPELLVDGSTYYVYGPDGLPLEQISGSNTYYYLHDQLGSTRVLTNSSGSAVDTYTYNAYGGLLGSTGTVSNPFGFAGAYTDAATGLIYLINRYYDPSTGQFLNVDPAVAETGQPYSYVGDDPLNGTDPLGLWCLIHNSSGGCLGDGLVSDYEAGGGLHSSEKIFAVESAVAATALSAGALAPEGAIVADGTAAGWLSAATTASYVSTTADASAVVTDLADGACPSQTEEDAISTGIDVLTAGIGKIVSPSLVGVRPWSGPISKTGASAITGLGLGSGQIVAGWIGSGIGS